MGSQLNMLNEIDEFEVAQSYECCPHDLIRLIPTVKTDLTVISQNIRSIYSNINDFQITVTQLEFEPDFMILTECRLNAVKPIPRIPNYTSLSTTNRLNQNDGVVVYFKNNLNASVDEITLEQASCIQIRYSDIVILGIYRSPSNTNAVKFINSLNTYLEAIKLTNTIIITGDININ